MTHATRLITLSLLVIGFTGCVPNPESGWGFRLPDGDPATGKQAFLALQCNACHTISGLELPKLNIAAPVSVELGGPVTQVRTYGQLVTSIINPSHKLISRYPKDEISNDGKSIMPDMNDLMTVRQLVDLVAFLQGQYELVIPAPYPYAVYRYEEPDA
jgi:sulfur-oxidizing protein SoxX